MNKNIKIANRSIGEGCRPFVIAELSGNHQQSYALAIEMIEAAAASGADAIKLQTYTADSMTLELDHDEFLISDENSLWQGESLHELYQKAATPYEWHEGLFAHAKQLGLIAFSSPFDEDAVDFLESLDVPCYKIASFENTDLSLIRKVAKTGKPVIISTGMASVAEIEEAFKAAREVGCEELILLKCTSAYPAPSKDINLQTILDMKTRFDCLIGLSDHTVGSDIAIAASALGAVVIEKHFVLDRTLGGVDAAFSLEPRELRCMVDSIKNVSLAMGGINYGDTKSDTDAKRYRRSLYISESIQAGEKVSVQNLRTVRPGLGLAPKYAENILGRTAKNYISKGTAVSWDLFIDE